MVIDSSVASADGNVAIHECGTDATVESGSSSIQYDVHHLQTTHNIETKTTHSE